MPHTTATTATSPRSEARRVAAEALTTVNLPTEQGLPVDGLGAAGLKKLELARALATRPKLLLADESLGGLDDAEIEQAADMLSAIRREQAASRSSGSSTSWAC